MSTRVDLELDAVVAKLKPNQRQQVLEYARSLPTDPDETPRPSLLDFAGIWSKEEAQLINEAIEDMFERVCPYPADPAVVREHLHPDLENELQKLTPAEHGTVLRHLRFLCGDGVPGCTLLKYVRCIPEDELRQMAAAIEDFYGGPSYGQAEDADPASNP